MLLFCVLFCVLLLYRIVGVLFVMLLMLILLLVHHITSVVHGCHVGGGGANCCIPSIII